MTHLVCGALTVFSVILTGKLAGQDLSSQTQAAVPALRQDADVPRHHWCSKLTHHRSVLIHVPIEQLQERECVPVIYQTETLTVIHLVPFTLTHSA